MEQTLIEDVLKRHVLFTPCQSKEALHDWIKVFLDIDLPDQVVADEGPNPSNSSPMDMVWSVYKACLDNETGTMSRVMAYASRDSFKSLAASILEVLSVLHLGRDVGHMAAVEAQSLNVQGYVKSFFDRPYLKDFKIGDSKEKTDVVFYKNGTETISEKHWLSLGLAEQGRYKKHSHYIKIVVATMRGCNSLHVPFLCVDGETEIVVEDDVVNNRAKKRYTARGLFNRIAGLSVSGRPSPDIEEMDVPVPVETVRVLSVNMDTGKFEFQPVERGHRKKSTSVVIETETGKSLTCTPDHPVYVNRRGFVEASAVAIGDELVYVHRTKQSEKSIEKTVLKDVDCPQGGNRWEQVLIGSLLGDGGCYRQGADNNPYFKEQHCVEQGEYLAWKRQIISEKVRTRDVRAISGYTGEAMIGFSTGNSSLFLGYETFRSSLDPAILNKLGPLGLAVWYMDDGCSGNGFRLSTEGWSAEENKKLRELLGRFGIETVVGSYSKGDKTYFYLRGGVAAKVRLAEICAPYIHPSMAYKFDVSENSGVCEICGSCFLFVDQGNTSKRCGSTMCELLADCKLNKTTGTLKRSKVVAVRDGGIRWVYDFTVSGNNNFFTNGFLSKNCIDEVDVVQDPKAYKQSRFIPSVRNGKEPITLLTSTRKTGTGLVQAELDNAEKTGLRVLHWNILDVTEKCPETRHRPDLPKLPVYRSDDTLKALTEDQWKSLSDEDQKSYARDENVFQGCVTNCKIYAVCRGKLATKQKKTAKETGTLRTIVNTQNRFIENTADENLLKAEMLCWRPSSENLIYPRLNEEIHKLTPAQIAEKVLGEPVLPNFTKQQLYALCVERDMAFYVGMDFGFSHNYVVVLGVRDGARMFVLDCWSLGEMDDAQKIDYCTRRIKHLKPVIFADPEDPSAIKQFKRAGFLMREWQKGKGSVKGGIEAVRMKLWPVMGREPQLYFIRGDAGVDFLFEKLKKWHWIEDKAGRLTDEPTDDGKDEPDALRYMVMNVYAPGGRLIVPKEEERAAPVLSQEPQYTHENWMKTIIEEHTGMTPDQGPVEVGTKGKRGNFSWDL